MIRYRVLLLFLPFAFLDASETLVKNKLIATTASNDMCHLQFRVAQQKGATCGLNALYNVVELAKLPFAKDRNDVKSILHNLQNTGEREKLFGKVTGVWSQKIALHRTQGNLHKELHERLGLCFKGSFIDPDGRSYVQLGKDAPYCHYTLSSGRKCAISNFQKGWIKEELDFLFHILSSVARDAVKILSNSQNRKLVCAISPSDFFSLYTSVLDKRYKDSERPEEAASRAIISKLIEDNGARLHLYFDPQDIKVEHDIGGMEWADREELQSIVDILDTRLVQIFFVGDNLAHEACIKDDSQFQSGPLDNFINQFQQQESSLVGIFMMYLAASSSSDTSSLVKLYTSNSQGHWFSIVANKVCSHVQYLIADSLSNTPRLKNKRFLELIAALSNDKQQEKSLLQHFSADDCISLDNNSLVETRSNSTHSESEENMDNQFVRFIKEYPFFVGFMSGTAVAAILIAWKHKKDKKNESKEHKLRGRNTAIEEENEAQPQEPAGLA